MNEPDVTLKLKENKEGLLTL